MLKIPIVKLPYELPINCKLTFNDSIILEVCLHMTKLKTSNQSLDGIASDRQEVKFRLVNPKKLPESIKINSRALAEITDNDNQVTTKYVLIVTRIIQSQWREATEHLGAVLEGVLIQETSNTIVNPSNPFGD
jgi:hypothetical protein